MKDTIVVILGIISLLSFFGTFGFGFLILMGKMYDDDENEYKNTTWWFRGSAIIFFISFILLLFII